MVTTSQQTHAETHADETRDNQPTAPADTMRAMVYDDYGAPQVLHPVERPVPRRSSGEILIAVQASSVNPIDYRIRRGELKGLLPGGFPRIPGYDVAGSVIQADDNSDFQPGDRVLAFLDAKRGGACADYVACPERVAAKIPDSMSWQQAAAIPLAGTTALQSLRDHGRLQENSRVLINGASGGVGAFAIQIAKSYHCHVTAIASGQNRSFCLECGADQFYDYEGVDFTTLDEKWDIVFDVAGKSSYADSRSVLSDQGRYVSTEPDVKGMLMTVLTWPLSKSGTVMLAKPCADDLRVLIDLFEQGQLTVTIDRQYPLEEAAAAHQRVESGVDRGKVVIVNT